MKGGTLKLTATVVAIDRDWSDNKRFITLKFEEGVGMYSKIRLQNDWLELDQVLEVKLATC